MAQSTAYILSAPYSNITDAYNVSVYQGTQVVYSSSSSQSSVTEFFADSELIQPIIGTSLTPYIGNWYGFRLLSNPSNYISACTIAPDGSISID
jgi:hypothetical protein